VVGQTVVEVSWSVYTCTHRIRRPPIPADSRRIYTPLLAAEHGSAGYLPQFSLNTKSSGSSVGQSRYFDRPGEGDPGLRCFDSALRRGLPGEGTNSSGADSEGTGSPDHRTVCTAGMSGSHAVQHQDAQCGIRTYRFRWNHPATRSRIRRKAGGSIEEEIPTC
jgi:hypothetical protein